MKWIQKVLSIIAVINLVVSPSLAQTAALSYEEKAKISQYSDRLESMGYRMKIDYDNNKALVYDKKSKQVGMEIPFAGDEELRKFSPRNMNQMLQEEMAKIKNASKATFSHTVRNLPTESAMFFMAMGAVVAGQLVLNYSQNPMAMKQHIEHSLSPIGVLGFFTFMYSQGVTSNVLAMYLKNPKLHHMIPYLGMTVGFTVQSYLSQLAMDPNVRVCAKVMMGGEVTDKDRQAGVEGDPCEKAYDYLVIQKKMWEFAPGIASMLLSAAIASVGQKVLTTTILRVTGVDIAAWLIPGSTQVKGIRLLLVKGLQISAFVAIDLWLHSKVNYAWKNVFDGKDFYKYNEDLVNQVNAMKKSNWTSSAADLRAEVKHFKTRMMDWRMMNLSEVYEAHSSWSEALHQLTAMFNTSYAFYNTYINEIRNSRFNQSNIKPLEESYPLFGITPKDLQPGKEDMYISSPRMIEAMQMETVADAALKIEKFLGSVSAKYLYAKEVESIRKVLVLLKTEDKAQIAQALKQLNSMIHLSTFDITASPSYNAYLTTIRGFMGNPTPYLAKGQGFVRSYMKSPSNAETTQGTNFYRKVGAFKTTQITDYLFMQMLCGPDVEKGAQVVKMTKGFPAVFLPPRIANSGDELAECFDYQKISLPSDRIYDSGAHTKKQRYESLVSYLNLEARPSIVGSMDQAAFPDWWANTTESQMKKAFDEFSKSYDEIVVKLVDQTYLQYSSAWNRGPMANGTMSAAFQEERVYLSLLNELLVPSKQYNVNFANILTKAPTHPVLQEIDKQFQILNGLIKQIKITEIEGRKVVQSPLENYQLEEQLQNIQVALAKAADILGAGDNPTAAQVQLKKQQRELAIDVLENLQSLASEVMMYGSMSNAVSWDKIRNLKRVNMEQNKFNNETQAKFAQMARGLSAPGKP